MLFESLSLSVERGQKTALIAKNGAGKSALLRILAGKEAPDEGKVATIQGLRIGYLQQEPVLDDQLDVIGQVLLSQPELPEVIRNYEEALSSGDTVRLEPALLEMDRLSAWDAENRIKEILSRLKISDFSQKIGTMSGGQRKRVALASVLIMETDLLLLDEPTNHLDVDMIEWLEEYLGQSGMTLVMVTHDRYFLDRVCNEILELDGKQLYRYKGNYQNYLDRRSERMEMDQRALQKANSLLKKELEWVNRMPQARGTKAKYRLDAFEKLREETRREFQAEMGEIQIAGKRLGKKVLEVYDLSKSYGDLVLLRDFSYKFQRLERIGIIGPNGVGKSTFLSMLTGMVEADSGRVDPGLTLRTGHYRQEGINFNPDDRVIDAVRNIAEVVDLGPGRSMSASHLLDYFLFPREVQYGLISKLSGGERRRLYLLTILMKNPNFLILDEPTNDLDIFTLNVLEDYLLHFIGTVIIVSHDRYFMDKVVDHIFVFEGSGLISDFPGNYSMYRDSKLLESEKKSVTTTKKAALPKASGNSAGERTKMTFKEKREFESLGMEIASLEAEKRELENLMGSGELSSDLLVLNSHRIGEILQRLDKMELRWLELSELNA